MATISKFYLLDAVTPNTGTMPSGAFTSLTHLGSGTDASGFATARDATDTPGTSNPDIDATATSAANQTAQRLSIRRFVSRPLAATTFANADGDWTYSWAQGQSNSNHAGSMKLIIFLWRPSTGLQVGTTTINYTGTTMAGATAETAKTNTARWSLTQAILDGDILVFEITDTFTQTHSSAYTSFFSYDGTTEGSTTTCATFVTPPAALTLYSPPAAFQPRPPGTNFNDPGLFMEKRNWLWMPKRPKLWCPELWTPPVRQPTPAII